MAMLNNQRVPVSILDTVTQETQGKHVVFVVVCAHTEHGDFAWSCWISKWCTWKGNQVQICWTARARTDLTFLFLSPTY